MNRRAALLLALVSLAPALHAQRMTGVVRDSSGPSPLSGAVVATLDAQGRSTARVITDGAGRYSVQLGESTTQLRVVRIGFQPRVITLAATRPATVNVSMLRVPTLLSTVTVSDDRVCSATSDRAAALALWEQARAGLLTSIVAREAKPASATMLGYERTLDNKLGRVVGQKARRIVGRTTQPFVAPAAPPVLAERGYVSEMNGEKMFNAPDADVLLDESFAATHCFSVRPADATHAGQIGLGFEPVRGRERITDVRGTLWLDAVVPALRTIEFTYAGGDASAVLRDASGVIRFRTMANGVVFVDEWMVRVPVMQQEGQRAVRVDRGLDARGGRGGFETTAIRATNQTIETGGLVQSARWTDGESWESPIKPLNGVVVEHGTGKPMAGALVAIDATGDTVTTDAAGRWAIFPLFPGRYELTVLDTSYSAFVSSRQKSVTVEMLALQTEEVRLELTGRAPSLRNVCSDKSTPGNSSMLLGRLVDSAGTNSIPSDVRVTATWLDNMVKVNTALSIRREGEAIEPDDRGRFSICGIPREMVVTLAVTRLGVRFADTTLTIAPDADTRELTWRLNLSSLGTPVPRPTPARHTPGENSSSVVTRELSELTGGIP